MIVIRDTAGNDLTVTPPPIRKLRTPSNLAACNLQFVVEETDPLPLGVINVEVDWSDGLTPDSLTGNYTVNVNVTRNLPPGTYVVRVTATDGALPVPSETRVNTTVVVTAAQSISQPTDIVYGPVLPRDAGYPGPQEWLFNIGHDAGVLESSLKMLLLTAIGERTMEPTYGTRLRQMLFDPLTDPLRAAVQEEVVRAVSAWEPRVELQFLSFEQTAEDGRSVNLNLSFVSKLDSRPVALSLQFRYA